MPFTKITEIPLGPLHLQIWGLLVALGMIAGLVVSLKEAKRKKISRDFIYDLFIWIVILSMVFGRLFYVFLFLPDFLADPLSIFKIWSGGMVMLGGVFGGVLAILLLTWKKKYSFGQIADLLVPGLALGIFIGRIGCYLIGDHIGAPMAGNWPWGSYLPGEDFPRHEPSLYLSLKGLILFSILWTARKKIKTTGVLAASFLIGYTIFRFFLDFFRCTDLEKLCDPRFSGLTISQIISVLIFLGAFLFLVKKIGFPVKNLKSEK